MRLIDADKYIEEESEGTFLGDISIEKFNEITPTVEAYTKDEVISILTNLQKKMEEYEPKWVENDEQAVASCRTWEDLDEIIQNKINTLRGDENECI